MSSTPAFREIEKLTGLKLPRIRLWVLSPFLLFLLGATVFSILVFNEHEHREIGHYVNQTRSTLSLLLDRRVTEESRLLEALMEIFARDRQLQQALIEGNRRSLLERARVRYEKMKEKFNMTHFYFIRPDGVSFLRLHQPDRFGDRINRFTLQAALKKQVLTSGIELGPLGTLTLRVVKPWYHQNGSGKLVGFLEAGVEVDFVVKEIQSIVNHPVFIAVAKRYLNRELWHTGMRMLNRRPQWEQFNNFVLVNQSHAELPPGVGNLLAKQMDILSSQPHELIEPDAGFRLLLIPVRGAGKGVVGQLITEVTLGGRENNVHDKIVLTGLGMIIFGAVLFGFQFWHVSRIESRLREHEMLLSSLAVHDGLTKLFNHKTFYMILKDEVERSHRYGKSLALLLIDLDQFKQVNDTHGHVIGDKVLSHLAEMLKSSARKIDSVCRYGGEEFAIVMPETTLESATAAAERIRACIEAGPLKLAPDFGITVTASIGVAVLTRSVYTADAMVDVADRALYKAKDKGRNRVCSMEDDEAVPVAPVEISTS